MALQLLVTPREMTLRILLRLGNPILQVRHAEAGETVTRPGLCHLREVSISNSIAKIETMQVQGIMQSS